MVEGKLIQPLVLDVKAFKQRYKKLIGLSSFERANLKGLEAKRRAWAAYRPLANEQLHDGGLEIARITLLNPYASRAPKRSTHSGANWYEQSTVIHRPTEILALLHALGVYKFDHEDIVIRQDPNRIVWYCVECKSFKPLAEFMSDKSNPHGLAFACNRCRRDNERKVFKRAA